jgi:hypothetical protein
MDERCELRKEIQTMASDYLVDFDSSLTEVIQTPGGKALLRCGQKTIELDSIHSFQAYRKTGTDEAIGTIVYFRGLAGKDLMWSWAADYDDVMEVVVEASKILSSNDCEDA